MNSPDAAIRRAAELVERAVAELRGAEEGATRRVAAMVVLSRTELRIANRRLENALNQPAGADASRCG